MGCGSSVTVPSDSVVSVVDPVVLSGSVVLVADPVVPSDSVVSVADPVVPVSNSVVVSDPSYIIVSPVPGVKGCSVAVHTAVVFLSNSLVVFGAQNSNF